MSAASVLIGRRKRDVHVMFITDRKTVLATCMGMNRARDWVKSDTPPPHHHPKNKPSQNTTKTESHAKRARTCTPAVALLWCTVGLSCSSVAAQGGQKIAAS